MQNDDLKRELERLAARLQRVEQRLGIQPEVQAPAIQPQAPPPPPTLAPPVTPPPVIRHEDRPGALKREPQPTAAAIPPRSPTPVFAPPIVAPPIFAATTKPQPVPPRFIPSKPQPHPRSAEPTPTWEMIIGGKWMAWAGALVVLLAMAFLIMVGVQQGWWGRLPPGLRCAGIAGFGALLLLGGEIGLRRIGRAASVGLFGAGLGTLYMDAYATFHFFDLVSREWAFVLMAVVALIGFAITLRTRFITIGVLSIIGGYATPLLLRGPSTHDMELLSYLTMLLGIALGLSAAVPRDFRALRFVAMGAHMAVAAGWLIANAPAQWQLAIFFMSVWWVMVMAESIYAALRRQSALGNVTAVLLMTAAYVTAGCWVLRFALPAAATAGATAATGRAAAFPGLLVTDWLGLFSGMVAILSAAAAFQFGPGVEGLRALPRTAIEKLALALWAQFGVLLTAAIAMQFRGFAQSIGWLAVALAAIEIGRRLPSRGVTWFGLIVGGMALFRVVVLDWWITPGMQKTHWVIGEVSINKWSLLALATISVMHVAARRMRAKPQAAWEVMPVLLAALATVFWLTLCALQCDGLTATAGWLLGAAALLGVQQFGPRQRYFEIAMLALIATAGRWLLVDAILQRMDPGWSAAESLPVLNWQMGLAVAIAIVGWWAYRILRRRTTEVGSQRQPTLSTPATWQIIVLVGALFALIALSFETDRLVERVAALGSDIWWAVRHVRQLAFTLLWTFGSLGLGMLAFALRQRDAHGRIHVPALLVRFAWGLLALCAVKWVLGDTLLWVFAAKRSQIIGSLPVANLQLLVGIVLAVAAMVLLALRGSAPPAPQRFQQGEAMWLPRVDLTQWVPVAASLIVLWGLTFEVDRALARILHPAAWLAVWDPAQLRTLWWTALWAAGGAVMMLLGRRRRLDSMMITGWGLIAGAAAAWLTFDTLVWRFNEGAAAATVVLNLQFFVGAFAAALLAWAVMSLRNLLAQSTDDRSMHLLTDVWISLGLIAAIGLWAGSLEIDRFVMSEPMKVQVGLSIYWGLYAVMLVLTGFSRQAAPARYAGLALLAITLGKAFIIDMKEVELIWRALIFLVVGLLLIGTSMVYMKLAPRLLAGRNDEMQPRMNGVKRE